MGDIWIPGGYLVAGAGSNLVVRSLDGSTSGYGQAGVETVLNVAAHQTRRTYRTQEVTHSGSAGMIMRRRVGIDWKSNLFINWDVQNIPELLLQDGNSVSVALWLGAALSYAVMPGGVVGIVSKVPVNKRRCYWAPSALLEDVETIADSTGTKIIGQTCSLAGNGPLFILPDETAAAQGWLAYMGWSGFVVPTLGG